MNTAIETTDTYRQLTEAFFSTFETGIAAQRNMIEQKLGSEKFEIIRPAFEEFANRERLMNMAEKVYRATYTPEVAAEILEMTKTKAWAVYMQHGPQVSVQIAGAMQEDLSKMLESSLELLYEADEPKAQAIAS